MAIDELIYRIRYLKNPSVAGLDPQLRFIPECVWDQLNVRGGARPDEGNGLEAAASAIRLFNFAIIDAVANIVPAVKLQIAMYERFGADGIAAYADTISYAKRRGAMVIADIKRGDIDSTAEAYADAHLGRTEVRGRNYAVFDADFATINPYLGEDAVEPFIKACRSYGKGVFILVKTSNPMSGQIQDLPVNGAPLYEYVAGLVSKWGKDLIRESGYSEVGAVVGATHTSQAARLREIMPHTFFLAPGYGFQGAKAADIVKGSVVNSSRGIIAAYQKDPYKRRFTHEQFALAAAAAAADMREDLSCLKI
ncbi:MAG: orotidine-5'-phosphate decarboxylase [Clostridiales bacterium]|jgi:orotidine-5'-phosphate decarboxylase|nr:orotidine-5'-phosphate decarboxylase [Clostridiales bacterium]